MRIIPTSPERNFMLTPSGCLQRQKRLRTLLSAQRLDAAILTDFRDIYYFTGKLFQSHHGQPACLFLATAGESWLVGPSSEGVRGVDEVLTYSVGIGATMHLDWQVRLTEQAHAKLKNIRGVRRLGWQAESLPRLLGEAIAANLQPLEWSAIDNLLLTMQRCKDPDELEVIRASIRCDLAAYDAAQKAIRPGATELEVLAAAYRGAQQAAGEKVIHDGDYQAGSMGGPARNIPLDGRDLYVIDAWTFYRGYWSDLCRTYSIGNKPTELQQSIHDHVAAAHQQISPLFKPGARGTDIAQATQDWLRQHPALHDLSLAHHAGHGTGIRVHMEPDLNLLRQGILQEGDLVCFEPAAYLPNERVFVRLENTYHITADGPRNLVDYPFQLRREI